MITQEERLLKLEQDAWTASMEADRNAGYIFYVAMMSDIDLPMEGETENVTED